MSGEDADLVKLLMQLSKEEYCYLTTKGRNTGNPHEIEIWFGANGNSIYLLSGGGDASTKASPLPVTGSNVIKC